MGELINGRVPEEIKSALKVCPEDINDCPSCPYTLSFTCRDNVMLDALALIERLEAERDAAVNDLNRISHCFTCANQSLNKDGECVNSGGGGAPFMCCSGYVWDKGVRPDPPKEGE